MAKLVLLPLAAGVVCFVLAGLLAMTIGALDLTIHDVYFVISPKYLLITGALLVLASVAFYWREGGWSTLRF